MTAAKWLNRQPPPGRPGAQLLLWLLALFFGLMWLGSKAVAQDARPVRLVVPTAAGGDMDATARLIAGPMAALLNTTIVIENKPGASTNLGTEQVAHGPADGRTLLMVGASFSLNPLLFRLPFDPTVDLTPVAQISRTLMVLAVRADLPANTPQELLSLARSRSSSQGLNCGAAPGVYFLSCEYLRHQLGHGTTTVPFNGIAPSLTSLLGGHVDIAFLPSAVAAEQLASGKIKVIAAAGTARSRAPFGPGVARMEDTLPGFPANGYFGIVVQGKTSPETVQLLNRAVNAALADKAMRDQIEPWNEIAGGPPESFDATIRQLRQRYAQLAQMLQLKTP